VTVPNTEGGVVTCSISLFSDSITFIADVQPCASPADVEFEIKDTTFGVDYTKTLSLDTTEQFDIPGASLRSGADRVCVCLYLCALCVCVCLCVVSGVPQLYAGGEF
jgi:hypothetical protein